MESKDQTEVMITIHLEAILFFGWRTERLGLMQPEVDAVCLAFPVVLVPWAGRPVAAGANNLAKGYVQLAQAYKKQYLLPSSLCCLIDSVLQLLSVYFWWYGGCD